MLDRQRRIPAAAIVEHHDDPPPPGETPWVEGYAPTTAVRVVDADPGWPAVFAALERRIRDALGERALAIEHVGSTSVAGLAAKPVIDVDLIVADSADETAWLPPLGALGGVLVIREPWWQQHRVVRFADPVANVHVFGPDAPEPVRHVILRDWLRAHPADRDRYAAAKREAADAARAHGEHVMQYNARKQSVIREVYARAFAAAGLIA
ncbi:GrpB family protein [Agrococcus jejuensis]|nr:GrpB family protein [Agrococcus jejuensis]